jgi:hypothetical protein
MKLILDSRPLEPVPVVDDKNRVTSWEATNDPAIRVWHDHIASSGLRALTFEDDSGKRRNGHHSARAVFRHPAWPGASS